MRNAASVLFEELIVARTRFAAASRRHERKDPGRRPRRSRSKAAEADRAHHRAHLQDVWRWFNEAGGTAALNDRGRQLARAIARERLRDEASRGRCLCPGRCPSRSE